MKTYRVPRTDLVVTRLAYGCGMLGVDRQKHDFVSQTTSMINAAHDQGINFFDTADSYGNGKSELALGAALRQLRGLRDHIVIQSKCGQRFDEGGSVDNSYESVVSAVEGSLRRLGTDRLDILLLHWPDSLVRTETVARAFDELHRDGKVRYFGVSNHNPHQIELLQKHVNQPLIANQIQLGLAHWYTRAAPFKGALTHGFEGAATVDYCRVRDIQVQAYSPLRAGNIFKSPNFIKPPVDASAEVKRVAQAVADVANVHNTNSAAVMLAWLLHHPAAIVPIIGSTNVQHLIENCAADQIQLSRTEWYSLLHAAEEVSASGD